MKGDAVSTTDLEKLYQELTGPGAPFELREEDVLGERMSVFARRPRSLRALLDASLVHGDREFIVSGTRRITYAEHHRRVIQLAVAMRDKWGVGPGDRVAILGANAPEWILAFWAATSLGAIAVGLNGWWSQDEIRHALADCQPKLLVGDRKRLARLEGGAGVPSIEMESDLVAACGENLELPAVAIDEDDPACILYTSGTTGKPKGAVLSHRSLIASVGLQSLNGAAMRAAMTAPVQAGQPSPPLEVPASGPPLCSLLTTPLFHVSGLNAGVVMMLALGARVVLLEGRFDALEVMRLVERERVTSWSSTPTMSHRVMNHPEVGRFDLSSLTQLGSGGSPLRPDLQRAMRERCPGANLGLGYGLTESGGIATINSGAELEHRPGSSGRAMPGVEVEVRSAAGAPVPDGVEGEIFLRSPLVMLGYWRNPVATAEAIGAGRWLATGDIGRIEEGHLHVDARARDLILRGGENVYPVEIEQALESHSEVDEAAVVGVDHEELGQEVAAFVVPRAGAVLDVAELEAYVSRRLAAFKVPSVWRVHLEPLPRNASGKLLKRELGRISGPSTSRREYS